MTNQIDTKCRVEPLKANSIIKGWRLIAPNGAILLGTTRREVEQFANFIDEQVAFVLQKDRS